MTYSPCFFFSFLWITLRFQTYSVPYLDSSYAFNQNKVQKCYASFILTFCTMQPLWSNTTYFTVLSAKQGSMDSEILVFNYIFHQVCMLQIMTMVFSSHWRPCGNTQPFSPSALSPKVAKRKFLLRFFFCWSSFPWSRKLNRCKF